MDHVEWSNFSVEIDCVESNLPMEVIELQNNDVPKTVFFLSFFESNNIQKRFIQGFLK